jgi:hypothetical protein
MKKDSQGQLLRIFIGESDKSHGEPLFENIVRIARKLGLSGATVLRGVEGFGANSVIHSARMLDLSGDLPIVIEVVDTEEKIALILPEINNLVEQSNSGALITLEKVMIIKYSPSGKA